MKNNEEIVGMKEFAEILGWSTARLSNKYHKQKKGRNVRGRLPEPIQVLASTPVWKKEDALKYKRELGEENGLD